MMNATQFKELEQYLKGSFTTYSEYRDKVLLPVFGNEYMEEDDLTIKNNARQLGEIYTTTDEVKICEVIVPDNMNLARARRKVQEEIRASLSSWSMLFVVYHYEHPENREWRISYAYKKDNNSEITPDRRFTYLLGPGQPVRTPALRLKELSKAQNAEFNNHVFEAAFNVEALSDEFFYRYLGFYASFVKYLTGKPTPKEVGENAIKDRSFREVVKTLDDLGLVEEGRDKNASLWRHFRTEEEYEKAARDYVKKLLGRLVFLHFLQKKGWMCGNQNFMLDLFNNSEYQDDFLDRVLEPLFFAVLDTHPDERELRCKIHNENSIRKADGALWSLELIEQWKDIPYLNGGLFQEERIDAYRSIFPKEYFALLFDFFAQYNFTIDENDPDDAEVGIDPEMLSKIFENLLEDNNEKGAFYTPKDIVTYMCQESLTEYLCQKCAETGLSKDTLHKFIIEPTAEYSFTEEQVAALTMALQSVKVCDPAIGSGAFPMGMLNAIFRCRTILEPDVKKWQIKRDIIQNNIYGVDIEQGAVDIARLRFWLSLIVDEERDEEDGSVHALPNLDYHIVKGNSLIPTFNDEYIDLSKKATNIPALNILKKALAKAQSEYFGLTGKAKLLKDIEIKTLILKLIRVKLGVDLKKANADANAGRNPNLFTGEISSKDKKKIEAAMAIEAQKRRSMAELYRIEKRLTAEGLSVITRARTDIKFFDWEIFFGDIFSEDGNKGFDIVIGNPPYKIIGDNEKNVYAHKDYILEGHVDLYELFIQHGMNILQSLGTMVYINPNTLLSNLNSKELRKKIIVDYGLRAIDNFKMDVFSEPTVHTCIMHYSKGSSFTQIAVRKGIETIKELNEPIDLYLSIEDIKNTENFTFDVTIDNDARSIFRKTAMFSKLGDICYLRQCIKTGNDKTYVCKSSVIMEQPWKKTLRGRGIDRYYIKEDDIYLKYGNWLARNWANTTFYERSKIAIREAGNRITACLDTEHRYFLSSIFAIYPKDEYKDETLCYLLGILNSTFATYYIRKIAFELTAGAFTKMRTNQLARLPIPFVDNNNQLPIVTLVNQILAAKNANPQADTSALESEIDVLVYHLYNLTYDEVVIVDPQTSITREEYDA